jgi:hypothetical protein
VPGIRPPPVFGGNRGEKTRPRKAGRADNGAALAARWTVGPGCRRGIATCSKAPVHARAECKARRLAARRCFGNRLASALHREARGCPMDGLFVFVAIAFFAVSLAYVRGCDRL